MKTSHSLTSLFNGFRGLLAPALHLCQHPRCTCTCGTGAGRQAQLVILTLLFSLSGWASGHALAAPQPCKVDADAIGPVHDGTSWETAFTDLQSALGAGSSCTEVWVAAGVYMPTPSATLRSATFQLKDGVALYGGFNGTETDRLQRNPMANLTILSGDIDHNDSQSPVITDLGTVNGNSTNSYNVVTGVTGAVLDGFTITAGYANGGNYSGGGLYNYSSSLTLTNVTFRGNYASMDGGGLYNYSANPAITDITFKGNSATNGGGMASYFSGLTLVNCTFSGNSATTMGGGLYSRSAAPLLNNLTFTGNSAVNGGGLSIDGGHPILRNSLFWGNTATYSSQIANFDIDTHYNLSLFDSVVQTGCPIETTCTNLIMADPRLGALGNYGGFTQTIPLLAGSSAIDAGNDATCAALDQRGFTRPQGAHCDIGAFENTNFRVSLPLVTIAHRLSSIPDLRR